MVKKRDFLWNTIGGFVYSLYNAIILMICTRLNGVEIAGIFSISYATGSILNAIGDWGIRIFQVTDTDRKYKFEEYLTARTIAVFCMLILGFMFVIFSRYTAEKLFICLILVCIRVIDNFSETFQSELQLRDRLDQAGKALLIRNTIEILSFFVIDFFTKNVYWAFGGTLLSSIIVFIMYDARILKKFIKFGKNKRNVFEILKECIPLAISTLVSMYVINAVKYAIDIINDNEIQTYFNILYMPTFVINLISILLIKPFLKSFGEYWNNREYKKFLKIIIYLILVLAGSTLVIIGICAVLGIKVLNILYGVNLNNYKLELILLVVSGFTYAASTVIFYALGTIRKQKSATISYLITAVLAFSISNYFVKQYGMLGATIATNIIMFILMINMTIAFIIGYNKLKKKREFLLVEKKNI